MKKSILKSLYLALIIFGIICAIGTIYISAVSEKVNDNIKSIGFLVIGYAGVISFVYGWMKLHQFKKAEKSEQ